MSINTRQPEIRRVRACVSQHGDGGRPGGQESRDRLVEWRVVTSPTTIIRAPGVTASLGNHIAMFRMRNGALESARSRISGTMYEIELNGTPVATCDTQDEASRWRDRLVKSIRREFPGYTGYRITVVEIDERGSRRKAAPAA